MGGNDSKKFLVSCPPPPVLSNTWGGHDTKKFLLSYPSPVLGNTWGIGQYIGGHDSDLLSTTFKVRFKIF